jgi:glucosyl-dolichyl phosphate glucuronosyltransferase
MSYRRSVFAEVGTFDSEMGRVLTLPLGCEETLHGIRAQRHYGEGTIVHVPTSIVDHQVPPERATMRYMMRRCFAEGLSKAAVAKRVGASDASSAERRYVAKVLPSGLVAGVLRFVHGEVAGLGAAVSIVLGLGMTVIGYVVGRLGMAGPISRWLIGRSRRLVHSDGGGNDA